MEEKASHREVQRRRDVVEEQEANLASEEVPIQERKGHGTALYWNQLKGKGPSELPIEVVHLILLELAHHGHKEAILAALIVRHYAKEILQISFNSRIVHWSQLNQFERKMCPTSWEEPPSLPFLTINLESKQPLTCSGGTRDLLGYKKYRDMKIDYSCLYSTIKAVKLDFKITELKLLGFYSTILFQSVTFEWLALRHLEHLTLADTDSNCQKTMRTCIHLQYCYCDETTISCRTLWIDNPNLCSTPTRRYRCLFFPSVEVVYLSFNFDTLGRDECYLPIFLALEVFFENVYIPPKAKIALLINFKEGHLGKEVEEFEDRLEKSLFYQARSK